MNKANLRLSWRDYHLLKLAFDISVALNHAGYIPEELLQRMFAQFVYTSPARAILNLRQSGLVSSSKLTGYVQVYDVSTIARAQMFGEDEIRFSKDIVQTMLKHWREKQDNLFDSDTIDETDLNQVPNKPSTSAKKGKTSDDNLLEGVDVPQIMANIIHVHELLGKPIPSWASYSIVELDCPDGKNPTSVRAALNRKGYLAFQTGLGPHTWYPTDAGRQLADNDLACQSLSEKDLRRLCN